MPLTSTVPNGSRLLSQTATFTLTTPDSTGAILQIDGGTPISVAHNGTYTVNGLAVGNHQAVAWAANNPSVTWAISWGVVTAPGTYKPSGATTGVPPGMSLAPNNASVSYVTTAGAVIDGQEIFGRLVIQANNVTIKRCRIYGWRKEDPAPTTSGATIRVASGYTGTVIEDCTIMPNPDYLLLDAVHGADFTIRRCEIMRTEDGVKIFSGNNARVEACWIHRLRWAPSTPQHNNDETHDDSVQIQSGTGHRLIGNVFEGGINSCIQITQDVAASGDIVIDQCWFNPGHVGINIATSGRGPVNGVTVSNCKFTKNAIKGKEIISAQNTNQTFTNNTFEDDGSPVRTQITA